MSKAVLALVFLAMTWLGALGSVELKLSVSSGSGFVGALRNWRFWLGGGLYFVSALLNIFLLKYIAYSVLLPLTGVTYCWSLLLAWKVLGEHVTKRKVFGIFIVVTGMFLLVCPF